MTHKIRSYSRLFLLNYVSASIIQLLNSINHINMELGSYTRTAWIVISELESVVFEVLKWSKTDNEVVFSLTVKKAVGHLYVLTNFGWTKISCRIKAKMLWLLLLQRSLIFAEKVVESHGYDRRKFDQFDFKYPKKVSFGQHGLQQFQT